MSPPDRGPDPEALRLRASPLDNLRAAHARPPTHKRGQEFLKGPIPLHWLDRAARPRGRALAVALVIWFRAGITKNRRVVLSHELLGKLGVERRAAYRGLRALEAAGLVSVERPVGRCPRVTLVDVTPDEDRQATL